MSAALSTVIKFVGLFLLAALASEVLVGVITGAPTNSTITLINSVIMSLVDGVVSIIAAIPVIIINFGIAIINAIFGTSIGYLPYP